MAEQNVDNAGQAARKFGLNRFCSKSKYCFNGKIFVARKTTCANINSPKVKVINLKSISYSGFFLVSF